MNIKYLLKNKIMIQFGTSHYYDIIASARQSSTYKGFACIETVPYHQMMNQSIAIIVVNIFFF